MDGSPSGHGAGNCRSGQTLKKPKYLSVCDREECGSGEGVVQVAYGRGGCRLVRANSAVICQDDRQLSYDLRVHDSHVHVNTLVS